MKKWNWGAFLLTWVWGLGNHTLIALLMFVPLMNMVMPFILGAKGNQWAWKNREWQDLAHFRNAQRRWAKWACILTVLFVFCFVILFSSIFFGVTAIVKHSEPYQKAVTRVTANEEVISYLGSPVQAGFMPTGNVQIKGDEGAVDVSFSIRGPKGAGKVYVNADLKGGEWSYTLVGVEIPFAGKRMNLAPLIGKEDGGLKQGAGGGLTSSSLNEGQLPAVDGGKSRILHLKNGNQISGTIVSQNAQTVVLNNAEFGEIVFSQNEIESIE